MPLQLPDIKKYWPEYIENSNSVQGLVFDTGGVVLHLNQGCKAKLFEAECVDQSLRVDFSAPDVDFSVDDLIDHKGKLYDSTIYLTCRSFCLDIGAGWEVSEIKLNDQQFYVAIGASQRPYVRSEEDVQSLDIEKESLRSTYEKLAEKIPGFVFQFKRNESGECSFPFISSGFSRIFEESLDQLRQDAKPVLARVHRDDRSGFDDSIDYSAKYLSFWKHTFRFVCSEGNFKWVQGIGVPEQINGSIVWSGFMYDISDKMNFEQKLSKQQAELEEIAFLQAHEFRRPVANILSLSDMIEVHCREIDALDNLVDLLGMLKKSVREADEVIAKIVSKTNNSKWLVSSRSA